MPSKTQAYVVNDKIAPFTLKEVPVKELGAKDVRVKFICSGLCHTDVHMQRNDWGVTVYPTVPGHEGIGRIVECGNLVQGLKVGQKVGVGWISGSCEACKNCIRGEESICKEGYVGTYIGDNAMGGTFQQELVLPSRFAYPVPDELPSALCAPLLCAGITVYAPLRKWVKPNHRVGIISVGGLGHLAIQFARALGADVTVFSTSKSKEKDAFNFGASQFVISKSEAEMKAAAGSCDVILNTCPYPINLDGFIDCLVPDGVLCYVGLAEAGESELKVNLYKLVFGQKSLVGSIVGGSSNMIEMFEIAKKFNVSSSVEIVNFSQLNDTCEKLLKGDMNGAYRYCLAWDNEEELRNEMNSYSKK